MVSPSRQECQQHRPLALTNLTGYLASLVSAETGCGTADAPWSITGLPGQRVNITLFDFSVDSVRMTDAVVGGGGPETGVALGGAGGGTGAGGGSRICVVYATIRESSGRRSVTICGGEARRKVVHVSLDNCIEIRMISNQPEAVSFLIHYEGQSTTTTTIGMITAIRIDDDDANNDNHDDAYDDDYDDGYDDDVMMMIIIII